MKVSRACTVAFAIALSGAALAADKPLQGYSHDNKDELFGYYVPKTEIRCGKFRLETLSIGTGDEMKTYESGQGRIPTYAPVMFTFQDLTSQKLKNEMGDTYYANEPRVLPLAYRVAGNTIAFAGSDKQVGAVAFNGTIDARLLNAVQADGILDTDKVILSGDLTVAGKVFKGVKFRWFGGD